MPIVFTYPGQPTGVVTTPTMTYSIASPQPPSGTTTMLPALVASIAPQAGPVGTAQWLPD